MNRHSAPNIPGNTLHTPVDLAAARVEVSERAEELLAHRGTPSAFVLDFCFRRFFYSILGLRNAFGVRGECSGF